MPGPIATSTEVWLTELEQMQSPLGQIALALADALDQGAGMATAAVAKELRATLKELTPDDAGDDFSKLIASLSAPVRDSAAT